MAQTIPFQSDQYFSRSWKMLTRDKGWLKPVLLLAVGSLVPILGFLVLMGYAFEWARLTAWGAETAPKQRNIQIGECLKSGGRAFVVTFIWGIPLGILTAAFGWLPPLPIIIGLVGTIVSAVAALRATIFQSITAGLQLNRIFEMVKHNWRGLARIAIGMLVIATIIGIVFGMVLTASMFAIVPTMGDVFYDIGYISSSTTITAQQAMDITMAFLRAFGPVGIVLGIIGTVVSTILSLVVTNAVGLWMLQFNVPAWGASEDPLPLPIAPVAPYGAAPASTVVPHEGAVSARVRTAGETAHEPVDISAAPVAQAPVAQPTPQQTAPQQAAPHQAYQTPSGDQIQPLVVPPTQTPVQAPAAEVGEIPVVPVASLGADAQQEEPAPAPAPAPVAPTRTPAIDDETAQAEAYAEAVAVVAREEGVAPEEIAKTKAAPKAAAKKTTTRKTTTRKTAAKKDAAEDEAAAPKKTTKKTTAAKKTTTARKTAAAKKSADDDVAPKKATTTRRATAKKSAAAGEETVAKKTTTRKTAAKKTTTRATSAKKDDAPAAKKTTTRRTSTAKKDEAKKSAPVPKAPSTRARKTTRKKEEDASEQE